MFDLVHPLHLQDWRESQLVAYKERGKVLTQKGEWLAC